MEKFNVEENSNPRVIGKPITVAEDKEMEWVECPHCNGLFAVDSTYLDQMTEDVNCPMCCLEVVIAEEGADKDG